MPETPADSHRVATLRLMSLTLTPFDQTVRNLVDDWRVKFQIGLGEELPPNAMEALGVIEKAFRDNHAELEETIARMYQSLLTESEMNEISDFYESPAGKHLSSLSSVLSNNLADISMTWMNKALKETSDDLVRLFDNTPLETLQPPVSPQSPS